MTEAFNDHLKVDLIIGGDEWNLKEAEVKLSRGTEPNFADILMIPPDDIQGDLPAQKNLGNLLGAPFELRVDNNLINERTTNAKEDTLLFKGNLANVSKTGDYEYEAIAYDPSRKAFTGKSDSSSIMNQTVSIEEPTVGYDGVMFNPITGTRYKSQSIKASDLIQRIVDKLDLPESDVDINLKDGGVKKEGPNGAYYGGFDFNLYFDKSFITMKKALDTTALRTQSDWWFDKRGIFHFGVREPTKHALKYITDASDGKTTPPYQSIRVIGSGATSVEDHSRAAMEIENKIKKEAQITRNTDGDPIAVFDFEEDLNEPTFEYVNLSITSELMAEKAIRKLAEELGEQSAKGTVTVVGFPEIAPLDGIKMPSTENQPLGGYAYGVYSVTHYVNDQDGFITQINVAGPTGVTQTVVTSESDKEERLTSDEDPDDLGDTFVSP